MNITRLDLDGTGSPDGLVSRILKAEPHLTYPIPIEEIAKALDILNIQEMETDGFEGGLIMDRHRSSGVILVNRKARDGRRRFTIGHELGHFCIPTHKPVKDDKFLCSRDDMRMWTSKEQNSYQRMEVEANRFAALLLMPPPMLRAYLSKRGDPNLTHMLSLHEDFLVSKDAAARAYAQHHDEPIAIAVVHDGKIQRVYRHPKFPKLSINDGDAVPKDSLYWRSRANGDQPTDFSQTATGHWIQSEWGQKMPDLFEQILHQQMNYALIMLWPEFAEADEDFDPDENMTSKQRLAKQQERWRR